MNHPTPQQLIEFFDDELTPEFQAEVAAHLRACDQCSSQMTAWRTARMALASWKLSIRPQTAAYSPQGAASRGRWRTAVAAAALVAAGFGLAFLLPPGWNSFRSDAELASEVRRQVQEELHMELAKFATSQESAQEKLLAAMNGRLDQLELQWLIDYAELRRDVETVAIGAQEGLRLLVSAEAHQEPTP